MTNIVAAIITLVVTNTTDVGEFTWKDGSKFDVKQDNWRTNHICLIEWKGDKKEFVIDFTDGPVIGERRVAKNSSPSWNITNCYSLTNNLIWIR